MTLIDVMLSKRVHSVLFHLSEVLEQTKVLMMSEITIMVTFLGREKKLLLTGMMEYSPLIWKAIF